MTAARRSGGVARYLHRKLRRDLWRTRAQALAIALVVACAVATVVMAANVRRTLDLSLAAYYEQYEFADVFATATRAPETLLPSLLELPGVAAVETRIASWAMLVPPGMVEPAVGRILSLPDDHSAAVNRIALRAGRNVAPGHPLEAVLSEPFAEAHGLLPGDSLAAHIGGESRTLTIVGLALSPEAVFAVGPGQIVPDDRRFGHLWMSKRALADALHHEGTFNDVVLRLHSSAGEPQLRQKLDALLTPHGGVASHGRAGHPSHAFVQGQIDQIAGLAVVLPPMFLLVAGFLLYGALGRVVEVERPQIGILKSLGIEARVIRRHYLQYAGVVAMLGVLLGVALGSWMGVELTRLYVRFFRFPLLVPSADVVAMIIALAVVMLVSYGSAAAAVRRVMRLAPAEALRQAAPLAYARGLRLPALGERPRMLIRQLLRHKGRAGLGAGATALAMGLIVATAFSFDALEHMIRVTADSERQDATVLTPFPVPENVLERLRGLPGVRRAEGFRVIPAKLSAGGRQQAAPLVGLPPDGTLRQLLSMKLRPMMPPSEGIALTASLADLLQVQPGDQLQLQLPRAASPRTVKVTGLTQQYFGVEATVALPVLNEWLGEGRRFNGARVEIDPGARLEFLAALRDVPALAGYIDQGATLSAFRTAMTRTLTILVSFFILFAVLTTIGVIYSNARILFTERRRDFAILRTHGYSARAVTLLLLIELMVPALLAVPLGAVLGRLFGWMIVQGLDSPLFRVPLVIAPRTDAAAVLVTLLATVAASLLIADSVVRLKLAATLAAQD